MEYKKVGWVNNVTQLNANNLGKMDDGIFQLSKDVQAIQKRLDETRDEMYKSAILPTPEKGVGGVLVITYDTSLNKWVFKRLNNQEGQNFPTTD